MIIIIRILSICNLRTLRMNYNMSTGNAVTKATHTNPYLSSTVYICEKCLQAAQGEKYSTKKQQSCRSTLLLCRAAVVIFNYKTAALSLLRMLTPLLPACFLSKQLACAIHKYRSKFFLQSLLENHLFRDVHGYCCCAPYG